MFKQLQCTKTNVSNSKMSDNAKKLKKRLVVTESVGNVNHTMLDSFTTVQDEPMTRFKPIVIGKTTCVEHDDAEKLIQILEEDYFGERMCEDVNLDEVKSFTRVDINGSIIHSKRYTRRGRTASYRVKYIENSKPRFGEIERFLSVPFASDGDTNNCYYIVPNILTGKICGFFQVQEFDHVGIRNGFHILDPESKTTRVLPIDLISRLVLFIPWVQDVGPDTDLDIAHTTVIEY